MLQRLIRPQTIHIKKRELDSFLHANPSLNTYTTPELILLSKNVDKRDVIEVDV